MTSRTSFTRVLATAAVLCTLAAATAAAQMLWNPPCPNVQIVNTSNCGANLRLVTTPAGVLPAVIFVPAGGAVAFPTPPVPFTINGINSFGGIFYPFQPPPPPGGCGCLPGEFHICCVTLGPAPGCCFDICGANVNPPCRITLRPSLCAWAVCNP